MQSSVVLNAINKNFLGADNMCAYINECMFNQYVSTLI